MEPSTDQYGYTGNVGGEQHQTNSEKRISFTTRSTDWNVQKLPNILHLFLLLILWWKPANVCGVAAWYFKLLQKDSVLNTLHILRCKGLSQSKIYRQQDQFKSSIWSLYWSWWFLKWPISENKNSTTNVIYSIWWLTQNRLFSVIRSVHKTTSVLLNVTGSIWFTVRRM